MCFVYLALKETCETSHKVAVTCVSGKLGCISCLFMDLTTVVDLTPSSKFALKVCETSCRVFWVCPEDKGELRGVAPPYGTTIWRIIRTRWVTITEQELTWSWRLQSANVILLFIASDASSREMFNSWTSVLPVRWVFCTGIGKDFPLPLSCLGSLSGKGEGNFCQIHQHHVNFLEWIAPTVLMNITEVGCLGMKREVLERPWGYY
jgi:hypothetical protein